MKNLMMFLMMTMAVVVDAAVPSPSTSSSSSSATMDVGYAAFFPRSQRSAMNRIKSTFTADAEQNDSMFDNNFAMTYPFLTQQSRKKNESIHQYRGGGVDGVDGGSSSDAADAVVSSNNKAE